MSLEQSRVRRIILERLFDGDHINAYIKPRRYKLALDNSDLGQNDVEWLRRIGWIQHRDEGNLEISALGKSVVNRWRGSVTGGTK